MKGKNKVWTIILKRELASYFTSPMAYIVCALFLLYTGITFVSTFFLYERAELRYFFESLPRVMSFFIPAMTMRIFAEEKKSGSIETLITLPVTSRDVVCGKYLASFISSLVLILPTLFYVVMCCLFGKPDMGPIIGGYLGSIFLIASFCAIGIFCSAITKNQLIAFFVGVAICLGFSMINYFMPLVPGPLVSLFTFISATSHFQSISRGIIDSRDIIYFISLTALFIVLTLKSVNDSRRG
ncbi:MAG: ABC transporter permease subunit [Treponema sp.]|nr:ABC transporter permease subunit [Treponema sp.]MBP5452541.1 ABC transporter permease subunit [Treponema sp.]